MLGIVEFILWFIGHKLGEYVGEVDAEKYDSAGEEANRDHYDDKVFRRDLDGALWVARDSRLRHTIRTLHD